MDGIEKEVRAMTCRWFGHKWEIRNGDLYSIRHCKRCTEQRFWPVDAADNEQANRTGGTV